MPDFLFFTATITDTLPIRTTAITTVKINSKEIEKGDLFICTMGVTADRHDFIDSAIENGAAAIVVSKDVGEKSVPIIKVEDTNKELPELCRRFYDFPHEKLHMISVGGTDGKTSTVGSSKNFTITIQNKQCQNALKRIDKQLERIEMCEGTGMWATAAYFLSYNEDRSGAETAATLYRSIIQGEQSGVETYAINVWYNENKNFHRWDG